MIDSFSDFIYIADGALEPEFCRNVIEKFEKDDNKRQGIVAGGRPDTSIKDSTDLHISGLPEWEEEDHVFYKSLKQHHEFYLNGKWSDIHSVYTGNISDKGYQIQRTRPGAGYIWHNDAVLDELDTMGVRFSTYIWYLNDIDEDGYTEFIDGTKVQPKTGRICIFPATWTYMHRGYPPKNQTKYIVTGWMHSK